MKTEVEFKYYYMWYNLKEGCSFDPWDVNMAWRAYQETPSEYSYLFEGSNND